MYKTNIFVIYIIITHVYFYFRQIFIFLKLTTKVFFLSTFLDEWKRARKCAGYNNDRVLAAKSCLVLQSREGFSKINVHMRRWL